MLTLSPEQWRAISPYLEEALGLEEADRAAWLEGLRSKDPQLAKHIESWLREHAAMADEGYLEQSPVPESVRRSLAGQTIGSYTLQKVIGHGGMGSVWLAERSDGRFQRQAAIKFVSPVLARGGPERFRREGSILGRLSHPHIAELVDAGVSADGQPYLVLEYVEGKNIDEYCDEHRLDIEARVRLFLDVFAAVAHAHSNLIVHRDIKPSNVMVRNDGQVKLLDFGIAKLLEEEGQAAAATLLTQQAGGALTPAYAAPEQVTSAPVTTATDVYSLGVLLYVLLTGQHPAKEATRSPAELVKAIVETQPSRMSDIVTSTAEAGSRAATRASTPDKLHRQLLGDLDTIVAKALKKDPRERYASVTPFADDLQRYLKHETISARRDTFVYRTAKFLRRNRVLVAVVAAAVTLVIGALSAGLLIANRQRRIAEERFTQVRQLANQFLALDSTIRTLPGSTKARQQIVSTGLSYLEHLSSEVHNDRDLALEVGTAYLQVARVQGVPTDSNLGDYDEADKTLAKGEKFVDDVLRDDPNNRKALLTSAQIAEARMILALGGPANLVLAQAAKASARLDMLLSRGNPSMQESESTAMIFTNIGNEYTLLKSYDEAIHYDTRAIATAHNAGLAKVEVKALTRLASAFSGEGQLQQALDIMTEAESIIRTLDYADDTSRLRVVEDLLIRKGSLLGEADEPNLGKPDEAALALQKAFEISDQLATYDRDDSTSRFAELEAGRELAEIVAADYPKRALEIYDKALFRVRETKDSRNRKTNEADCLADSALALLELHRLPAAKQRIDAAFALLRESKLYPAQRIRLRSPEADTLRASAGYEEAMGRPQRARAIYEEIRDKSVALHPESQTDLRDVYHSSQIMAKLARLYAKTGQIEKADRVAKDRRDMWRQWQAKQPDNSFIREQLKAAQSSIGGS